MKHVVQYSGGVGSWAAAKLVAKRHGTADLTLLFADVKDEHVDLYRFLEEGAANIGVPVTRISDGRTPRQVMTDEKFIGNSRKDPCSKLLKRNLLDKWCRQNMDPAQTIRYIGIDWTEIHRLETFQKRVAPWRAEAPLCEEPYRSKFDALSMLAAEGIETPELYRLGFSHNNCGGACIKGGQAAWARVLRHFPKLYQGWEEWEEGMRLKVGNHSILRDRSKKQSKPLTLKDFRIRVEGNGTVDQHEIGGCGCGV
jgi:hypothetical protein